MSRRVRRNFDGGFGGAFGDDPFTREEEDINPNNYIANLSDCMLVLAVGFIVALIVAWNVELPEYTVLDEASLTEIEDVERIEQQVNDGNGYNKVGEVYQDPVTGKTYVLERVEGEGAGAGDAAAGEGSAGAGGGSDGQAGGGDA